MFSRSQVLSVFPLWDPYALAFVLLVSSVITVWLVAALGISVPFGSRERKLSPLKTVLLGKEIFPNSPSLISPYISLEGTGSNRRLGSQAKENGAGSAWAGHIVSPNKMRAL